MRGKLCKTRRWRPVCNTVWSWLRRDVGVSIATVESLILQRPLEVRESVLRSSGDNARHFLFLTENLRMPTHKEREIRIMSFFAKNIPYTVGVQQVPCPCDLLMHCSVQRPISTRQSGIHWWKMGRCSQFRNFSSIWFVQHPRSIYVDIPDRQQILRTMELPFMLPTCLAKTLGEL